MDKASIINNLCISLTDCAGYKAFYADIQKCINAYSMCGLCQIRAEGWFDTMIGMQIDALRAYVDRYKSGWLDPFKGY